MDTIHTIHTEDTVDRTADQATARKAGAALALASALAIAGFTFLGSIFEYPQVLEKPTGDILTAFHDHQVAVTAWFGVLVLSAALLAPAGIWLGRIAGGTLRRWVAGAGAAAAAGEGLGLPRRGGLVPGLTGDALHP